ncbi:acyl-CoA binding protein [Cavenderia fasciculata]|uniref:Acyl-CoA binding protein n=1 Tax=Cavenderia fasciculata TaxID=261658 RepID=F4QAK4_CACFS|nr:acyl-CoA binding protein [Cavenderia fasciculata]EGG15723.1 acyl-CoA binding protein [Cavenderia fasciculata]|eukprot:XP_004354465.1 acyl-CoA binding protein [Cavenderia fasciculata]
MSLAEQFATAVTDVKKIKAEPTNDEKLELYGLYKQANEGDNTTAQPWAVQLEARAKHDAWTNVKGLSKDQAMEKYVQLVQTFKAKYGF